MSKELELIRLLINGANEYEKETGNKNPTVYLSRNNLLVIEEALQRLEAIEKGKNTDIIDNYMAFKNDNATPSEALKCLESIEDALWDDDFHYQRHSKLLDNIEQALLKAQEPKQYLKWEDLEEDRTYKVLLNGNQYELVKRYDDYEYHCDYIILQKEPTVSVFIYEWNKEIFNDLHLERVEE